MEERELPASVARQSRCASCGGTHRRHLRRMRYVVQEPASGSDVDCCSCSSSPSPVDTMLLGTSVLH